MSDSDWLDDMCAAYGGVQGLCSLLRVHRTVLYQWRRRGLMSERSVLRLLLIEEVAKARNIEEHEASDLVDELLGDPRFGDGDPL